MKAAKIFIKIVAILLTSVWGVLFGILTPVFIMGGDLPVASHYIIKVWLVMAVAGYLAPCVFVMLDMSRTAAAFSVSGTALSLFIHGVMSSMFNPSDADKIDASFMYLPQIFMTILTILYIFVVNPQYLSGINRKRAAKFNAPAPSIMEKSPENKREK